MLQDENYGLRNIKTRLTNFVINSEIPFLSPRKYVESQLVNIRGKKRTDAFCKNKINALFT
jgi:hypothetical protein